MKLVYVAGPYRGANAWAVHNNCLRAEQAAYAIASLGAMPVVPHLNTKNMDGTLTAEFWLEGTLELMRRCDAVYVLEGWSKSEGTKGEIDEAIRLDLPVFYRDFDDCCEQDIGLEALENFIVFDERA